LQPLWQDGLTNEHPAADSNDARKMAPLDERVDRLPLVRRAARDFVDGEQERKATRSGASVSRRLLGL
jgi:hypothetical protein